MKVFYPVALLLSCSGLAYADQYNFCACQQYSKGPLDYQSTIYCCNYFASSLGAAMEPLTQAGTNGAPFTGDYCGSRPAGQGSLPPTLFDGKDFWNCCLGKNSNGDSACYNYS